MEVMKQVWVLLPGVAWLVRRHELGDLCCPGLCLPQVRPIDNQGAPGCELCLWICGLGVGGRTSRGRFLFTHPNCFSRGGSRERLLWLTYTVPWADHRMRESRKTVSVGGVGLVGWQGWGEVRSLLEEPQLWWDGPITECRSQLGRGSGGEAGTWVFLQGFVKMHLPESTSDTLNQNFLSGTVHLNEVL